MKRLIFSLTLFMLLSTPVLAADKGQVVVSIAPLHSLVQGVMGETAAASLLVKGFSSPHGYQLKPSQLQALRNAALVFYIGDNMESFLSRGLAMVDDRVVVIGMVEAADIVILRNRAGGIWESHDHGQHDHHDDEEEGEGHLDVRNDFHVWLDPNNAITMISTIRHQLTLKFPVNEQVYLENATRMISAIMAVDRRIEKRLSKVQGKPFAVFHDGFQYFERRYNLTSVGSILLEPGQNPSISRLRSIRNRIIESKAVCIFQEPQYSEKLIQTVTEGLNVKSGSLDPVGGTLTVGAGLYVKMLEQLAEDLAQCLE